MSSPTDLDQFEIPSSPIPEPAPPPYEQALSRETKLAFLAHILTGAPFMQRYEVAAVGFIEFATVSPLELDSLRLLACCDVPNNLRGDRLRALMAVACVNRIEIDRRIIQVVRDRSWGSAHAYETFVDSIPIGLLQIIESQYADFSRTLALLISKVSDRSFWPTP
jgi:hypothetical protein